MNSRNRAEDQAGLLAGAWGGGERYDLSCPGDRTIWEGNAPLPSHSSNDFDLALGL